VTPVWSAWSCRGPRSSTRTGSGAEEELAQFLGVSRQIVNQHLQAWKSKGWIQLGRGSVTVCNGRSLKTLIRES
jgi:DNA-binding FadR family transcriptional regulator